MNFTLILCVIARSVYLYTLTSNPAFPFQFFQESIFIVVSIIALIIFSMAFNQIIKQDIFETDALRNVIHIDILTGLYNRCRFNLDVENITHQNFNIHRQLTVSMGLAPITIANTLSDLKELMKKADDALYYVKENGRNQIKY